jgi:hypothetical protein
VSLACSPRYRPDAMRPAPWSAQRRVRQRLIARDVHDGDLPEQLPRPFQLLQTHRAYFYDPIRALGKDERSPSSASGFHLHAVPCILPGFLQQMLFQSVQTPLGRSDQILHRGSLLSISASSLLEAIQTVKKTPGGFSA